MTEHRRNIIQKIKKKGIKVSHKNADNLETFNSNLQRSKIVLSIFCNKQMNNFDFYRCTYLLSNSVLVIHEDFTIQNENFSEKYIEILGELKKNLFVVKRENIPNKIKQLLNKTQTERDEIALQHKQFFKNYMNMCNYNINDFFLKLKLPNVTNDASLKFYTIYGERCSGTNYLEDIMTKNFNTQLTWKYGHKHFFGFNDLSNSDNTLFICIVRDVVDWVDSFFNKKHHVPYKLRNNIKDFIDKEFSSYHLNPKLKNFGNEIKKDRHIYTKQRYKNLFDLRHTKLKFMIEDLPKLVKNVILIRYEDLVTDFDKTMKNIRDKGCVVKNEEDFPVNSNFYKNTEGQIYTKKKISIDKNIVLNNSNLCKTYEKKLGYLN